MKGGMPQEPTPFVPPSAAFFDYTAALKFCPEKITNGHEFFNDWFMPPIMRAFNEDVIMVFICLDRGSPTV